MTTIESRRLLPEEDAALDAEGDDDEFDPLTPGDLWYRFRHGQQGRGKWGVVYCPVDVPAIAG